MRPNALLHNAVASRVHVLHGMYDRNSTMVILFTLCLIAGWPPRFHGAHGACFNLVHIFADCPCTLPSPFSTEQSERAGETNIQWTVSASCLKPFKVFPMASNWLCMPAQGSPTSTGYGSCLRSALLPVYWHLLCAQALQRLRSLGTCSSICPECSSAFLMVGSFSCLQS